MIERKDESAALKLVEKSSSCINVFCAENEDAERWDARDKEGEGPDDKQDRQCQGVNPAFRKAAHKKEFNVVNHSSVIETDIANSSTAGRGKVEADEKARTVSI